VSMWRRARGCLMTIGSGAGGKGEAVWKESEEEEEEDEEYGSSFASSSVLLHGGRVSSSVWTPTVTEGSSLIWSQLAQER
jgi:hypothetical protein